ncbi:unnamed protein product [Hyaloperonospora brassicae]|uniref:Uncharacterized protein n=1 Tax=Hyaloperonospora brassicae TaxID=162125 RepID=A0AAV0TQ79_HYABA|nr:unnamed protein product [Hyaloperonospora brassicae]
MTDVNENVLLEYNDALVARVTGGNAYDADRQRLLRESFDDDELMLPVDNEERAVSAELAEETAPILGKALGGRLHTGLAIEGASGRLVETAVVDVQRAGESQGRAVTSGQHVEENQPKMNLFARMKSLWAKLKEWLTKPSQEFVKWIKSLKAKDKPVGERNTADVDNVKKSKAANADTIAARNGGAGHNFDFNGAANAGGLSTGEKLKPLVGGAARAAAGGAGKLTTLDRLFVIRKTGAKIFNEANGAGVGFLDWNSKERQELRAGTKQARMDLNELVNTYGKKSRVAGGGTTNSAWDQFVTWRVRFVRNINDRVVGAFKNSAENEEVTAVKTKIKEFVDPIERLTSDTFRTFLGMDDPAAAAAATMKVTDKSHS